MIIVKVSYTTSAGYAEENKRNIARVMSDLQKLNDRDINYDAFIAADGKSFTHFARFQSEEGRKVLNGLESFKQFQEKLKASGLESPPKQELLTIVGSSQAI